MHYLTSATVGYLRRRNNWLAGFICVCAAGTLFARHFWIADIIANLRVQLILGLLAVVTISLILRRWRIAILVAAVMMWQATWLMSAFQSSPNLRLSAEHADAAATAEVTRAVQSPPLRVFLANVLTRNEHHDQIIAQIHQSDADVFAILELSSELNSTLNREFGETYKHVISETQDDGNFGIGLWSRYLLTDAGIFHLNSKWLPSIEANVEFNSQRFRMFATHPLPPMGSRNFSHRNDHLALLAKRIQQQHHHQPDHPIVLLGDLNLTPWSPFFSDLLESTDLRNAAAGYGLQPTWYRWNVFPFGLVLDHALHSHDLSCVNRQVLPANGSDHRAVIFHFSSVDPR